MFKVRWFVNNSPYQELDESDIAELERLIGGAKDFVLPSDQLRSKVVESVRSFDIERSQLIKLRNFVLSVFLVWLFVLGTFFYLRGQRTAIMPPTSAEVEHKSAEYASSRGYSKDWGMVDVFWESRGGDSQNTSPPQPATQSVAE
jgi:hypothetical protein